MPFDEWQRINNELSSYNELNEKYQNALKDLENEKISRRYYFKVGTDWNYEVAVTTVNLHGETFEQAEEFEKMIQWTVEKEMELRKEYDTKVKDLEDEIQRVWNALFNTPMWIIKLFGYRKKNKKQ